MIKLYFFVQSNPDIADETGPVTTLQEDAAELIKTLYPSTNAAVFSAAIVDAIAGRPPSMSGALELWFDDAEEANAASEVLPNAIFTNTIKVAGKAIGVERVVMRRPEFYQKNGVKGLYAFRRKSDLSVEDFQFYWWQNHGPIAALTEGATCYIQCHVPMNAYENGKPEFDGVTELYWPDVTSALQGIGSKQMIEDQSTDARNFVDLESVDLMIAEQHMIIPPWKETL
ncbi:MAG: hypothetical protein ACJAX5_000554 [Patiriisocius sp.]|jgi:uncharacterized protein (TIGR02118 family)